MYIQTPISSSHNISAPTVDAEKQKKQMWQLLSQGVTVEFTQLNSKS